ncbi:MAG: hypothetical protein ACREFO_04110 [Acetobacteraceae bacterium]
MLRLVAVPDIDDLPPVELRRLVAKLREENPEQKRLMAELHA